MNSARLVRAAVTAVLAVTLLTACSGGGDNGAVPRDWIRKTYTATGSDWLDPDSRPSEVARAIHAQRAALDRASGDRTEFLRYGDDMVTVSPYRNGSLIEIEDYRNGYQRHQQHLTYWPNPNSSSFRGGGPGEGK
ncbi:DUF4247 domain-containing protein [Streptomyces acidiscabies]|uniref:DUF4247 domain-containing protein n=1 Tax=Streptomyces acidiscabies TaxID=42234 RepID=A0ABU4MC06_9ACTN|nr:DUF4247 domain-containing protein [Streptomyces acidiscabies]MDX3025639.1 DUF4247 domain-containing protein [Streptomyces acidiscabies]